MNFHVLTGYGITDSPFFNKADNTRPGQGMLQGSSSAGPIDIDISLSTYQQSATGSSFTHLITKTMHTDFATQYVNDKTKIVNDMDYT
jgi:hypothetical protein